MIGAELTVQSAPQETEYERQSDQTEHGEQWNVRRQLAREAVPRRQMDDDPADRDQGGEGMASRPHSAHRRGSASRIASRAPSLAAFPNVSYAFMTSASAKRCVTRFAGVPTASTATSTPLPPVICMICSTALSSALLITLAAPHCRAIRTYSASVPVAETLSFAEA